MLNIYHYPGTKSTLNCKEHMSHASKVLCRMLLNRMHGTAEAELADVQMGLRDGPDGQFKDNYGKCKGSFCRLYLRLGYLLTRGNHLT